jgi:hypothetical protein
MDNCVADIGVMGFRSDQDAPSSAIARPREDKLVIMSMKQNNPIHGSGDVGRMCRRDLIVAAP